MGHPSILLRFARERQQILEREAATLHQLPSFRYQVALTLIGVAKWLEPTPVDPAPTFETLKR